MSAPRVSVVTPVYNSALYLAETLDSVLAQSMRDWEMLLVDDGSTDDSLAVAEAYASRDPRIRVLRSERNLGVARTRNRGVAESRGDYIALLDSDDLWMPDKLEKQLALADSSGADMVYCSYALIDEQGKRCCEDFLVPPKTDFNSMLVRSVISCSTVLIRADCMKAHPFQLNCKHEDLVLWLELLRDGCRAAGCAEVLAAYRLHRGSRSSNKFQSAYGRWRVFRDNMGMSFCRSLGCFAAYAASALRKYRRSC